MQKDTFPESKISLTEGAGDYHILDTNTESEFEEITLLASEICQTPISVISLIDSEKQWFITGTSIPVTEIPQEISTAKQDVQQPFEPVIVNDLRLDERFSDHPNVIGDPYIVFYAGIPITNELGHSLGTLCVMDNSPRVLSTSQIRSLKILATHVIRLLELKKTHMRLNSLKNDLEIHNEELQEFASVVSHDIKSPLASILLSSEMLRENFGQSIDEENDQLLAVLNRASFKIKNLVDGILAYYRAEKALREGAERFLLMPYLHSIVEMLTMSQSGTIEIPGDEGLELHMNKTALEQILVNLFQNGLKYNDKQNARVAFEFSEDEKYYYFVVRDNGKGIAETEQKKIFEMFTTLDQRDRFGTMGTGIGLSTVKRLVEKLGGKIEVSSVPGEGSVFSFYVLKEK